MVTFDEKYLFEGEKTEVHQIFNFAENHIKSQGF
jgi:hypothetical protein